MHLPFMFSFTTTASGSQQEFDLLSATQNKILNDLASRSAVQLAATNLPGDTDKFWVQAFFITLDSPAYVWIGWNNGSAAERLFALPGLIGGSGGGQHKIPSDGIFIPQKPRILVRVPAGVTPAGEGWVGGYLDVYKLPAQSR